MIAYKGFHPGLVCRDYQFVMGLNITDKANCAQNGFHCAENPLHWTAFLIIRIWIILNIIW